MSARSHRGRGAIRGWRQAQATVQWNLLPQVPGNAQIAHMSINPAYRSPTRMNQATAGMQWVCNANDVCGWVADQVPLEVVREYNRRNGVAGPVGSRAQQFKQQQINPLSLAINCDKEKFYSTANKTLDGKPHSGPHIRMEDYIKIYKTLGDAQLMERGGTFTLNKETNQLVINKLGDGQAASVDVPLGTYEFHTHPGMCQSKNNCALGVPSIADCKNILDRAWECNHTHLIFSWEGVYSMVVLRNNPERPQCGFAQADFKQRRADPVYKLGQKQIRELNELQSRFSSSRMSYEDFLKEWMQISNKPGSAFRVTLFPMGVSPYINHDDTHVAA